MRVYVKTVNGMNPIDFSVVGCVWTNDLELFSEWLEIACPSFKITKTYTRELDPYNYPWFHRIHFTISDDEELIHFKAVWGDFREKV